MVYRSRATMKSMVEVVEEHLSGVRDIAVLHKKVDTFSPISPINGKFTQIVSFIVVPRERGEYSEEALSSMVRDLIPKGSLPEYSIGKFRDLDGNGDEITVRTLSFGEVLGRVDSVRIISDDRLLIEQLRASFTVDVDDAGAAVVSLAEEFRRGIFIRLFLDIESADKFLKGLRLGVRDIQ